MSDVHLQCGNIRLLLSRREAALNIKFALFSLENILIAEKKPILQRMNYIVPQ